MKSSFEMVDLDNTVQGSGASDEATKRKARPEKTEDTGRLWKE